MRTYDQDHQANLSGPPLPTSRSASPQPDPERKWQSIFRFKVTRVVGLAPGSSLAPLRSMSVCAATCQIVRFQKLQTRGQHLPRGEATLRIGSFRNASPAYFNDQGAAPQYQKYTALSTRPEPPFPCCTSPPTVLSVPVGPHPAYASPPAGALFTVKGSAPVARPLWGALAMGLAMHSALGASGPWAAHGVC